MGSTNANRMHMKQTNNAVVNHHYIHESHETVYKGQGGHFQTHFEGHFQTQTTVNSVLTARDSISGPRKPRVISKHDQGVISNTLTKPWGHFQTQAYFLLPGTAFSGLSISFHVAPTHTFRLRLGGDWGLGWGLGWGKPCSTHTHL